MANTTTCIAMSSLPTLISFRLIEIAAARLPPKTPFLGAGHTIAKYSHTGYHVWSYQKCLGTIGAIVNLAGLLGRCWIEIGERSAFLLIQQIHKDCSCFQNLHKSLTYSFCTNQVLISTDVFVKTCVDLLIHFLGLLWSQIMRLPHGTPEASSLVV